MGVVVVKEITCYAWFDGFKFRGLVSKVVMSDDRAAKTECMNGSETYVARRNTNGSIAEQLA